MSEGPRGSPIRTSAMPSPRASAPGSPPNVSTAELTDSEATLAPSGRSVVEPSGRRRHADTCALPTDRSTRWRGGTPSRDGARCRHGAVDLGVKIRRPCCCPGPSTSSVKALRESLPTTRPRRRRRRASHPRPVRGAPQAHRRWRHDGACHAGCQPRGWSTPSPTHRPSVPRRRGSRTAPPSLTATRGAGGGTRTPGDRG